MTCASPSLKRGAYCRVHKCRTTRPCEPGVGYYAAKCQRAWNRHKAALGRGGG